MKRKIAKDTLVLLFSRFGSRLLIFGFGIYAARVLGSVNFGKVVFASAFILTFTPLADFGLENFLLREVSRRPNQRMKIIKDLFYPRILLAGLAYFLALASAVVLGFESEDLINVSLYGLMLIPYSLNYFFLAYFNAQEKFIKSALLKFFYPLAHVLLGLLFLILGFSYRWLFLAVVLGNLSSALVLLFFYPQIIKQFSFSGRLLKKVLCQTWPWAALIFIAVFYLRLDVIILKKIAGSQATGLYGPVSNLVQTSLLIPQSFALALFPLSSRLVKLNKFKMKRVYLRGLGILFLASLPIVGFGIWLSPFLIPLIFGQEYQVSIPAFQVAFLSLILFFVNALPGNVILNSKKVKGFIPWAIANLIVNLGLNLTLIPCLGFTGAAWAKLFSEFFGFLTNNLYVYRILG
ncbi:MAG: flippase [Candidatus Pacebacteria bacterium]|nr:flippase [Candidatus Paceibacterota bacterium]